MTTPDTTREARPALAPPEPRLDELADAMRAARDRFESLIEPHRRALWTYCRRLTGSAWDAEDLVQDALLRTFASLPQLWQPVNPRGYLFRVATNLWIDRMRQARRATIDALDEIAGLPAAGATDDRVIVREAIEHLVRVLPPRQRVVLLLCDSLDFRAAEVAGMLGTSEGAVKSALHRARATLAAHAAAEPPASRPTRLAPEPADHLVSRYLAAFNARDAEGIAALLHEEVEVTIVGSARELGREAVRHASLHEWAVDPREQWAAEGVLEGRPAVFVFYRTPDGARALAWVTTLEVVEDRIASQRIYYFCVELIEHAAALLHVPATTHGYQYVIPA